MVNIEAVLPPEGWQQYKDNIVASVDGVSPSARIIAVIDGEIVGSSLLFLSSQAAYGAPELEIHTPIIRLLAVSPSARGKESLRTHQRKRSDEPLN